MSDAIRSLKNLGQVQYKFQFKAKIPYIPFIGLNTEFEFLVRSTDLPEKIQEASEIRNILGQTYTIPNNIKVDHSWNVKILITEKDFFLKKLYLWFMLMDAIDINLLKTTATVSLLSLNGKNVNIDYVISGIYPTKFPKIEGLDYSGTEEYIEMDCEFSYDDFIPKVN